jgi:hypothetical protein
MSKNRATELGRKQHWIQRLSKGILVVTSGVGTGLVAAVLLGQTSAKEFATASAALTAFALVPSFVAFFMPKDDVRTAASYAEIASDLPVALEKLIADAKEIDIIGCMLTEFVRRPNALKALAQAKSHGAKIRILMLNPSSEAIQEVARDRKHRKGHLNQNLKAECLDSVSRIAEHLGWDAVEKSVRLYSSLPHSAVHRFGEHYIVMTYTFGRGGSSPTLHMRRSARLNAYCDGLDLGFQELWTNNDASRALTQEAYKSILGMTQGPSSEPGEQDTNQPVV